MCTMVKPTATRLTSGVRLSNCTPPEFDALLVAGCTGSRSHNAVQRAIKNERGGVLPINWDTAIGVKMNVEFLNSVVISS